MASYTVVGIIQEHEPQSWVLFLENLRNIQLCEPLLHLPWRVMPTAGQVSFKAAYFNKLHRAKLNFFIFYNLCILSFVAELGRDYKPDKLDKFILKRYGPKGKYLKTEDIPDRVT